MSENLRRYQRALYGFDAVVRRVPPDAWDTPSKCAEWTCREVAGHIIWHTRSLAATVGAGEAPSETPEAEMAGSDPAATWAEARDAVLAGLDRPDALAKETAGPFGLSNVDELLRISAADIYTHTWDIGAAVGIDPALDPSVAEDLLPGMLAIGDGLRAPGLMGAEVEIAPDCSVVDRYLAFSGRAPR